MRENTVSINDFNTLSAELNPICNFLALLGVHHILHISRIKVKEVKFAIWINLYRNSIVFAQFLSTSSVKIRSVLFENFAQPIIAVYYRRFGTTYRYHLQGSCSTRWLLDPRRWDPIGGPETSAGH